MRFVCFNVIINNTYIIAINLVVKELVLAFRFFLKNIMASMFDYSKVCKK